MNEAELGTETEIEPETAETCYVIPSSNLMLCDDGADADSAEERGHLEYHVAHGDYFSVLATLLGFLEESLQNRDGGNSELVAKEIAAARVFREHLRHLNEHYRIEPKT